LVHGSVKDITVKIADFDLSFIRDTISSTVTLNTKNKLGTTVCYLAPEILSSGGKPHANAQSDVFCLGSISI